MTYDIEKQSGPAMLSNPMQDGIDAAQARIKSLNLHSTLVSQIPEEEWGVWDASGECALVADQDYHIHGGFFRFAA